MTGNQLEIILGMVTESCNQVAIACGMVTRCKRLGGELIQNQYQYQFALPFKRGETK